MLDFDDLEEAEEERAEDTKKEAEAARFAEREANVATARARCPMERAKSVPDWRPVTIEQVQDNHTKRAPGMFYGFEFPWNADMMREMGAPWLTRAFRAAKTIPEDETVARVTNVREFVGGGACSKMLIDVEYATGGPGLHTKLFAKCPFPMEGKTMSDRLSSSVYQQGMDFMEANCYRLLESGFDFPIPKYYFADISNETTNFILITERVPFAPELGSELGPFEIEPPYQKMRDWELRGTHREYYELIVKTGARLAGAYKAERVAPFEVMDKNFENTAKKRQEDWGMQAGPTGLGESELRAKLKSGVNFITVDAKKLFPPEVESPGFAETYKRIMTTVSAYQAEINWWCNRNSDYIAWTHGNLNVDNVYFFRDGEGKLDMGILDWGGAQASSVGSKLWWWLYCCEYDFLKTNIDDLLQIFIDSYRESGGPALDHEELKTQFILAALQQGVGLLGAVPQIFRMCKKAEWATIESRKDPRIVEDVNGMNTLRIYVGTFINVVNMILEWDIPARMDRWVADFSRASGRPAKTITVPS